MCAALKTQSQVDNFAGYLVSQARTVAVSYEHDKLRHLAQAILDLPASDRIRNTGHYYNGLCLKAQGKLTEAERSILLALTNLAPGYTPRALLALGSLRRASGDLQGACALYLDASHTAVESDPLTQCHALRNLAIIRGIQGDHRGSLSDLLGLWPVTQQIGAYYAADLGNYLNSVAVELGELGRIDEATRLIDSLVSSPLAASFPAWYETKAELATMPRRVFTPFTLALGAPVVEEFKPVESSRSNAALPGIAAQPRTELAATRVEQSTNLSARNANRASNSSREPRSTPTSLILFALAPIFNTSKSPKAPIPAASLSFRPPEWGYNLASRSRAPPCQALLAS